jgi:hypothetical protein
MKSACGAMEHGERMDRCLWQTVRIVCLVPAIMYLLLLALALIGADGMARWLCSWALAGVWSVPMLLLLSLGGPTLSVIASLILRLDSRGSHAGKDIWGMVAWMVLLLSLCTIVPFPWLFMVAAD